MWDEEDGFYYDVLRLPDGSATRLKVRSMVGLLPLCATTIVEPWQRQCVPRTVRHLGERLRRTPELLRGIHATGEGHFGYAERGILALVNHERCAASLRGCLTRMSSLFPTVSDHSHASMPITHTSSAPGDGNIAFLTCRRIQTPGCLAATPTGVDRSGFRSTRY